MMPHLPSYIIHHTSGHRPRDDRLSSLSTTYQYKKTAATTNNVIAAVVTIVYRYYYLLFIRCLRSSYVIPNRRSSESKAMHASTLPSRDGGRRSHTVEGSLHFGRDDKPNALICHPEPVEGSQRSLHALRLVEMTNHFGRAV